MKRLFISQPMRGRSYSELLEERLYLKCLVEDYYGESVQVIDSYIKEEMLPLEYVGESLKLLASADAVIFAKGYEEARGCRIEYLASKDYGITIIDRREFKLDNEL